MARQPLMPLVQDTQAVWAAQVLQAVREALYRSHRGFARAAIDRQTRSAYKDPTEWVESTPFNVVVGVEPSGAGLGKQIYDPWGDYADSAGEDVRLQKAVEYLKAGPLSAWIEDAGWVSYNSGILYFWIKPRWADAPALRGLGAADDDATLPFEGDFPWISLTYGVLPPRAEVLRRVGAGETYPMELVPADAEALEECLADVERKFPFEEFAARHGKYGYRFTPEGLYALIECVVELANDEAGFDDADEARSYGPSSEGREATHRADEALDLVSSILQTLNIEWV